MYERALTGSAHMRYVRTLQSIEGGGSLKQGNTADGWRRLLAMVAIFVILYGSVYLGNEI